MAGSVINVIIAMIQLISSVEGVVRIGLEMRSMGEEEEVLHHSSSFKKSFPSILLSATTSAMNLPATIPLLVKSFTMSRPVADPHLVADPLLVADPHHVDHLREVE